MTIAGILGVTLSLHVVLAAVINQPLTSSTSTTRTETLDKMYERLRAEWKVDDKFEGHSEINAVLLDKTESKFAKPTGSLEYGEQVPKDVPYVDAIDPALLPPKPQRPEKGYFGKLAMSLADTLQGLVDSFPKSLLNYIPFPEPSSYITPSFDPAIHPPLEEKVYPAPEKKNSPRKDP